MVRDREFSEGLGEKAVRKTGGRAQSTKHLREAQLWCILTLSKKLKAVERKVEGDLVLSQRQSKAQQSANEQTWIAECAEALEECIAIASTLEDDPCSGNASED